MQEALKTKRGKLVLKIDEMWSFIGSKKNKVWIWLAIDSLTKEIVGVHVGARDAQRAVASPHRASARKLWDSLPSVYRQCATCYTESSRVP